MHVLLAGTAFMPARSTFQAAHSTLRTQTKRSDLLQIDQLCLEEAPVAIKRSAIAPASAPIISRKRSTACEHSGQSLRSARSVMSFGDCTTNPRGQAQTTGAVRSAASMHTVPSTVSDDVC